MKPRLHGVPRKDPDPYPIIEITGQVDTGKAAFADALAARLGAGLFVFPRFDFDSYTGRALLASLAGKGHLLEAEPFWWAHIYAANMLEASDEIYQASLRGPVVTTNYLTAFKVWMRAAGVKELAGFYQGQVWPTLAYVLQGDKWHTARNLENGFTAAFIQKVNRAMANPSDKKAIRIDLPAIQSAKRLVGPLDRVLADLRARYGLKDEGGYTTDLALRRGSW